MSERVLGDGRVRVARVLLRALGVWAAVTAIAFVIVNRAYALGTERPGAVVASVWSQGERVARAVVGTRGARTPEIDAALKAHPRAVLVYETVVREGPVLAVSESALALSIVAGRDGLAVTYRGSTEYLTPDDLLSREAYDKGVSFSGLGLSVGLDVPLALGVVSERLGATAPEVWHDARFRRFRVVRTLDLEPPVGRPIEPDSMTKEDVFQGALAAGRYLARGVDGEGRFRYMVDAPTNRTVPGYDWPRHAGATYFLAQIATLSGDGAIAAAALRAASLLRTQAMVRCGAHACIGSDSIVDVGSTALTVLAFVEMARSKLDASYGALVPDLAAFLREQQKSDGEFMHRYDRDAGRPIDVQLLYYSGEASLALSRAHLLSGDRRDLEAASRALARLVGPGWSFLGSHYYYGEEHWTCQAMADLWERAPNADALDFCLRWQAYQRRLQFGPDDTPFDADGAYGVGPIVTPRLTPVGSRSEAGIATLDAATRANVSPGERALLEHQMRRCLAQLLRHQIRPHVRPAQRHLFADPDAIDGAMPGSEVDWQLRIDYAQHTGSALIRWLDLEAAR